MLLLLAGKYSNSQGDIRGKKQADIQIGGDQVDDSHDRFVCFEHRDSRMRLVPVDEWLK